MNKKITLYDIEKTFKEKSWWAIVASLIPAKYLTYYIANYTKLTPNQVTFISLIFAIIAGIAFWYKSYVLGAFLYQISYIFDIVDGALARVTNQTSKKGAFFDVLTDWLKAPVLIIILLWNKENSLVIIIFLLFLNCCINKYNDMIFYTTAKSITKSDEITKSKVGRYFSFMKEKNIQPLPGIVEFEALVLFLYPIFQKNIFLYLAIFLLLFLFLLRLYVVIKKLQ